MSLEFSREVDIKHVPQKGQSLREQASQEECASLAARYKIDGVKSFELEVDIVKWKKSALRAKGKVKAVLVQECVVSLALFEQEVEEAFSVLLLPDYMMQTDNASTPDAPADLDREDEEVLVDGKADIGELAVQMLSLGIDPHPRKSDVPFSYEESVPENDTTENPFHILKNLKDD